MRMFLERSRSVWVFLAVGLLAAAQPAGSASMFTVDGNGNGTNEVDGSDDVTFSFNGSLGIASGNIRAVDLGAESASELELLIDGFLAFIGGIEPDDFDTMDVLIFDVALDASAPVCEVGVAVGTNPITDPDGAGYLMSLMGEQSPDGIAFIPGNAFFPGAASFSFGVNTLSSANLESGETSTRLFVVWEDGFGPQLGQTAVVSVSSGTNADFQSLVTDIVAMCIEDGQGPACTASTDCCSGVGNCTNGKPSDRVCASPPAACLGNKKACTDDDDCCSLNCRKGSCKGN